MNNLISKLHGTLDEIVDFIKINCSDILKECSGRFLYRGMQNYGNYILGESMPNRQPKDSDISLQCAIDETISFYGGTALRSNSYFVTGTFLHAAEYARTVNTDIYAIFPLNGYHYTWSYNFSDIVLLPIICKITKFSTVQEIMRTYEFITDDKLCIAIDKKHEIWFTGKYVGIKNSNSFSTLVKKIYG